MSESNSTDSTTREADDGGGEAVAVDPLIATDDNATVPAGQENEVKY